MKIFPIGEAFKIAVIDPSKPFGAEGQYVGYEGPIERLNRLAALACREGKEVRRYYRDLSTFAGGETVASQIILTDIPPGHVQPFHTHKTLHEISLTTAGEIISVESDDLTETTPLMQLVEVGEVVPVGKLVVQDCEVRHTVLNASDAYATFVTIQTARIPLAKFPHDWHRDK